MNDRNSLRPFRLRPIAKLRSPVIAVQQPPLTASLSTALSLALSLPLALHSLPQLSLPLSASLSLIFFFFLRSHSLPHSLFLSFTYLMSFNRTALALAMSLRKCQANLFHANFLKCHRYENVRIIPSSFFFFFQAEAHPVVPVGKTIIVVIVAVFHSSQFPMCRHQNCSFVRPTVQNPKTLNLRS